MVYLLLNAFLGYSISQSSKEGDNNLETRVGKVMIFSKNLLNTVQLAVLLLLYQFIARVRDISSQPSLKPILLFMWH